MRTVRLFNDGWVFSEGCAPDAVRRLLDGTTVRLPHNSVDVPLSYFDEGIYQREFCYQKVFDWEQDFDGREVRLRFGRCDGGLRRPSQRIPDCCPRGWLHTILRQPCRTPWSAETNLLTVRISGKENPEIPPFGGEIDYLTYAGIYRDVWLIVTGRTWIDSLKIETPDPLAKEKRVVAKFGFGGSQPAEGALVCRLLDPDGRPIAVQRQNTQGGEGEFCFRDLEKIELWDIDSPVLYRLELELTCGNGDGDRMATNFGFRSAEFTTEGFLLNGRPLKTGRSEPPPVVPVCRLCHGPASAGAGRGNPEARTELQSGQDLALSAIPLVP